MPKRSIETHPTKTFLSERSLNSSINPSHATGLFLYLLKTSENLWLSDVLRGYRKKPVTRNRLTISEGYFSWNLGISETVKTIKIEIDHWHEMD